MLTLSDIRHLKFPDQFFSYADAFLSGSTLLCRKVESDDTFHTWPHASMVLMLAAHSVELFLKGALLKRKVEIWRTHDINRLAGKYRETFPETTLGWDIPFANPLSQTELIAEMKELWPETDEAKLKSFITTTPHPSILYRYPVNDKAEWRGGYGFTPTEFLSTLDQIDHDFKRLRAELAKLPD